jgi:hypothetical protein
MQRFAAFLLSALLVFGWCRTSAAHLTGIETGGCTGCHHGGKDPTVTITSSSMNVMAGQQITLTIAISATNGTAGGFYMPAPSVGKYTATAGTKIWPDGGITHSMPAKATGNQVVFTVLWTAPTTPAMGGSDFPVYALSANGDNTSNGDSGSMTFTSLAYGCGAGTKYYRDNDGDHYGLVDAGWTMNCSLPPFFALDQGDCNDNDPTIHPGATEICDGKDNNCNGMIDEGLESVVQCEDKDGDGHGILNGATHMGCAANLKGFGLCDGDCNDNDPTVYPGAMEVCNFVDDNCNGQVDEGARPTCGEGWCRRYGTSCTSNNCTPGPPRPEQCNFFDDDCDGVIDNGTDLELCGEGLACRKGYCVPLDDAGPPDNPTTTSGSTTTGSSSATTGSTGSGTTSSSGSTTAGSGGGDKGRPPDTGGVNCSVSSGRAREGSLFVGLLLACAFGLRRKLGAGHTGRERRKSRSRSHEIVPCASHTIVPRTRFSRVSRT